MTAEREILAVIVRRLGMDTVLRLVREVGAPEKKPVPKPTAEDELRAERQLREKGIKVA